MKYPPFIATHSLFVFGISAVLFAAAIPNGNSANARSVIPNVSAVTPSTSPQVPAAIVKDIKTGYFHRAVVRITPIMPTHAGAADYQYSYAKALFGVGQTNKALHAIKKAVALDPKNAAYHRFMGVVYIVLAQKDSIFSALGDAHRALAAFRAAVDLAPPGSRVPRGFGAVLLRCSVDCRRQHREGIQDRSSARQAQSRRRPAGAGPGGDPCKGLCKSRSFIEAGGKTGQNIQQPDEAGVFLPGEREIRGRIPDFSTHYGKNTGLRSSLVLGWAYRRSDPFPLCERYRCADALHRPSRTSGCRTISCLRAFVLGRSLPANRPKGLGPYRVCSGTKSKRSRR